MQSAIQRLYEMAMEAHIHGENESSARLLERVLELGEDSPEIHHSLGKVRFDNGEFTKASEECDKISVLEPLNHEAPLRKGNSLSELCRYEEAMDQYRMAVLLAPNNPRVWSDYLYNLHYTNATDEFIYSEHVRFGERFSASNGTQIPKNPKKMNGKLRIGYVSSDFRNHAASFYIRPIFQKYNRDRFELFAYNASNFNDFVTDEFKKYSFAWRDIHSISDEHAVQIIRNDQIDMLVDLSGHTAGNRLGIFALRAAPIQISAFGYSYTSGLPEIDFRWWANSNILLPERHRFYTEKICYSKTPLEFEYPPGFTVEKRNVSPKDKNGFVTFGSFNSTKKINREVLYKWARIMNSEPNSRLKILAHKSPELRLLITDLLGRFGVECGRIQFEDLCPLPQFLEHIRSVDFALDTFPYSGGITTEHCVAIGTPVIAFPGKKEYERNGWSIAKNAGLLAVSDAI